MAQTTVPEGMDRKIRIIIGEQQLPATLLDNKTARDFINLLPLSLTLEDYAGTEKISDLPQRLNIEDAPTGSDPSIGDITYYAPWGNLAIFYKDFKYSKGLVILGHIDESIEPFVVSRSIKVKIERIE